MKVLLVQSGFLGDTVLSTPVIAGVKKIYPGAAISVMTTPAASQLIENDPLVKEVVWFDKRGQEKGGRGLLKKAAEMRAKGFDRAYTLHRSYRTSLLLFLAGIPDRVGFRDASLSFLYTRAVRKAGASHAVLRNLSLLYDDMKSDMLSSELRLFEPPRGKVAPYVKKVLPLAQSYIILAPGSAWETKMWHWQGFLEVARFFRKRGGAVVLLGSEAESGVCGRIGSEVEVIDLSGRISLADTLYVMKHARLAVTNDSMPLHMASAFKLPTVAVFCATSPAFGFGPWDNPHAAVVQEDTIECRPCRRHGSRKCPNGTEKCMQIPPERVIAACREVAPDV